jgi:hypothetical protein
MAYPMRGGSSSPPRASAASVSSARGSHRASRSPTPCRPRAEPWPSTSGASSTSPCRAPRSPPTRPIPMETTHTWHDAGEAAARMTLRNRGEPVGFAKIAAVVIDPTLAAHASVGAPSAWVLSNPRRRSARTGYGRAKTGHADASLQYGATVDLAQGHQAGAGGGTASLSPAAPLSTRVRSSASGRSRTSSSTCCRIPPGCTVIAAATAAGCRSRRHDARPGGRASGLVRARPGAQGRSVPAAPMEGERRRRVLTSIAPPTTRSTSGSGSGCAP